MNEENNIENYGDYFQQKSKYEVGNLPRHRLDWENKPDTYKTYENSLKVIDLPKLDFPEGTNFWQIVKNRHSMRKFSSEPLSIDELGLMLFGMSGVTRRYPQFQFRTVPSAGGLFPIEIYPIVFNVSEINKGIYHYNIKNHQLEFLKKGDFREKTTLGCLGQKMVYNSAVTFLWTAVIPRSKWKYLQRCYRYIYLDCGHIGQNFYLVAESLNLGACTIGAIFDDVLNKLINIDGKNETAIYVGILGKIK